MLSGTGKKVCLWGVALWIGLLAGPVRAGYETIIQTGPSSNRVDLVFLGDGYTANELLTIYPTHVQNVLRHLFEEGEDPYPRYRNFFNVHRVDVPSADSGADLPKEGVYRNTALDASFYYDGRNRHSLYIDPVKAQQILKDILTPVGLTAEVKLVSINSDLAGGGGGSFAVFTGGNADAGEEALHEMGHTFNGLADEYGGFHRAYPGSEPNEVNITTSPTGDKWSRWLGYFQSGVGTIGTVEGGYYYDWGIFCPSERSKMRCLGQPFHAVAREKIILDIYKLVRPLDSWTDNATELTDPEALTVKVVDPEVIKVEWRVNGGRISGIEGEIFQLAQLGFEPGCYTISARAYDPTDWVRMNRDQLEQTVDWTVQLTVPIARTGSDSVVILPPLGSSTGTDPLNPYEEGTVGDDSILSWAAGSDNAKDDGSSNGATKPIVDLMSLCGIVGWIPLGATVIGFAVLGAGVSKDPE